MGKLLASIGKNDTIKSEGEDYTIKLWSMPDGALVKTLKGHDLVHSVTVSPDGKLLVSGDAMGSIRQWSLPDGKRLACLVDLAASSNKVEGSTYTVMDNVTGQTLTYTLPCGSPIPPGTTCACNCVPGSLKTELKPRETCTCVPVCTCMAVRCR